MEQKKKIKKAMYYDKVINKIVNNNSFEFNILKTIEELNELSTALTQLLTKSTSDKRIEHVIEETSHVKLRVAVLCKLFDKNKINKELAKKLLQLDKDL